MEHVSEVLRPGIALPLDDRTESAMRSGLVPPDGSHDLLPLDPDTLLTRLYELQFFQAINEECGTLLDEHESGLLEPAHVEKAREILTRFATSFEGPLLGPFATRLAGLFDRAIAEVRPVLFVL